MRQRRICGYDVNGWRDFAARNWETNTDGEEQFTDVIVTSGEPLSDVIRSGEGANIRWIGGVSARLAPHGRGDGWGEIGRAENRRSVREYLGRTEEPFLASALTGLVSGAQTAVLSISDTPDTTEVTQERLSRLLGTAKIRQGLLVWRPVLAALHAIRQRLLSEGQTVGIVSHDPEGLSLQTLRIRPDGTAPTPERRTAGTLLPTRFGYSGLRAEALNAVVAAGSQNGNSDHLRQAASIAQLTFGLPTRPEVLRNARGRWEVLTPPSWITPSPPDVSPEAFEELADCDVILAETLCEGHLRETFLRRVSELAERDPILLPSDAVARGAQEAARRYASGEAVYFDFLPTISTIVGSQFRGAVSHDLVSPDETLPAGKVYRSSRPAIFGLSPGQRHLHLHLHKDAAPWPKEAIVDLGIPAGDAAEVRLHVEQTPAQGRAKIHVDAPHIGRGLQVEWDGATLIKKDWNALIEEQNGPRPTVPPRLILACGMISWTDDARGGGLTTLMEAAVQSDPDWSSLAATLTQRPEQQYCISSDGALPEDVGASDAHMLDALTARALTEVNEIARQIREPDTAALKFLTWQFRRCPSEVADLLMDEIERSVTGETPRFANHPSSWQLIYQGLGRVIASPAQEARAIRLLCLDQGREWRWREHTAAMAFLLSRSATAPALLTRENVGLLASKLSTEFRGDCGKGFIKLRYAPLLLMGLLRWRISEPYSLVAGQDRIADELLASIEYAQLQIAREVSLTKAKFEKLNKNLRDLVNELKGEGTNPNLPQELYAP